MLVARGDAHKASATTGVRCKLTLVIPNLAQEQDEVLVDPQPDSSTPRQNFTPQGKLTFMGWEQFLALHCSKMASGNGKSGQPTMSLTNGALLPAQGTGMGKKNICPGKAHLRSFDKQHILSSDSKLALYHP